jgi:ribosomal protein S21
MSIVVIQKEKDSFLRMFRQYLTLFNNTGITQNLKNNIYFVSPSNKKKKKRLEALRKIRINNRKLKFKQKIENRNRKI